MSSFPPYYQAARTHDRTETEIDFPVGLTPQPSIMSFVRSSISLHLSCLEIGACDFESLAVVGAHVLVARASRECQLSK